MAASIAAAFVSGRTRYVNLAAKCQITRTVKSFGTSFTRELTEMTFLGKACERRFLTGSALQSAMSWKFSGTCPSLAPRPLVLVSLDRPPWNYARHSNLHVAVAAHNGDGRSGGEPDSRNAVRESPTRAKPEDKTPSPNASREGTPENQEIPPAVNKGPGKPVRPGQEREQEEESELKLVGAEDGRTNGEPDSRNAVRDSPPRPGQEREQEAESERRPIGAQVGPGDAESKTRQDPQQEEAGPSPEDYPSVGSNVNVNFATVPTQDDAMDEAEHLRRSFASNLRVLLNKADPRRREALVLTALLAVVSGTQGISLVIPCDTPAERAEFLKSVLGPEGFSEASVDRFLGWYEMLILPFGREITEPIAYHKDQRSGVHEKEGDDHEDINGH